MLYEEEELATPDGWINVREVKEGTKLLNSYGEETTVLGTWKRTSTLVSLYTLDLRDIKVDKEAVFTHVNPFNFNLVQRPVSHVPDEKSSINPELYVPLVVDPRGTSVEDRVAVLTAVYSVFPNGFIDLSGKYKNWIEKYTAVEEKDPWNYFLPERDFDLEDPRTWDTRGRALYCSTVLALIGASSKRNYKYQLRIHPELGSEFYTLMDELVFSLGGRIAEAYSLYGYEDNKVYPRGFTNSKEFKTVKLLKDIPREYFPKELWKSWYLNSVSVSRTGYYWKRELGTGEVYWVAVNNPNFHFNSQYNSAYLSSWIPTENTDWERVG